LVLIVEPPVLVAYSKSLLEAGFCLGGIRLPPQLMERRHGVLGTRQTEGVLQLLGAGQHLMAPRQGLIRIAQQP
jgi:hypothetical protein